MPSGSGRGPSGSVWIVRSYCGMRFAGTCSGWPARTTPSPGSHSRLMQANGRSRQSPIGVLPRTGPTGQMQRGELWFAATPGGDRPVLVLTRDPVADRIGCVVVASLTRTRRILVSELDLTTADDGVPTDCVVNFDNIHTLTRASLRRRITT